jgi:hypothetical protein
MWVFTRVADAYDRISQDNAKWIDSGLQPWVATTLYEDHSLYRNIGVWTASGTLFALNKFTTTVAGGFIDVLRLGDGVAKGGWRGLGQDAFRMLTLLGPGLRALRYWGAAIKGLDEGAEAAKAARAAGLEVPEWVNNCTWMAAARALRLSGEQPLATLADLVKINGLTSVTETGPAWVSDASANHLECIVRSSAIQENSNLLFTEKPFFAAFAFQSGGK